jgi:hypothetical protein
VSLGQKKSCRTTGHGTTAKRDEFDTQVDYTKLDAECQTRRLRQAMKELDLTPRDIVQEVKPVYPGFDKTLLSKCLNADKYGVTMTNGSFECLVKAFPAVMSETQKQARKGDGHRLRDRVSCRLEKDEYEALQRFIREDGFDTMQSWLVYTIRNYIKAKREGE